MAFDGLLQGQGIEFLAVAQHDHIVEATIVLPQARVVGMLDEEVVGMVFTKVREGVEDSVDGSGVGASGNHQLISTIATILHVHSVDRVPFKITPGTLSLGHEGANESHLA
jgi:hypothetical protein